MKALLFAVFFFIIGYIEYIQEIDWCMNNMLKCNIINEKCINFIDDTPFSLQKCVIVNYPIFPHIFIYSILFFHTFMFVYMIDQ